MRKILLTLLLTFCLFISGQSVRDEMKRNIMISASNLRAYPGTTQKKLTPAPNGKKPFYISHYGRHGSRYLNSEREYDYAYNTLLTAHEAGRLSMLGEDVLQRIEKVSRESEGRFGELTPLGARQHQDIAQRMFTRFPEVFADDCHIDARSTVVRRCILSMENALLQLVRMNPRLSITHDASEHDMYYMNYKESQRRSRSDRSLRDEALEAYSQKRASNWQRMVSQLFSDTAYVNRNVSGDRLMQQMFRLASAVQNMEARKKITFYDLFTDNEIYQCWQRVNAQWLLDYGYTSITGGTKPFSQRNLLSKILSEADSCIRLPHPSASLRFGHDTNVLPLTCLLGINGFDVMINNLESAEKKGWVNYRVYPMASNIQIVFYRDSPADPDILLKVLLNENEAKLPLKTDCAPYYHWNDFRDYYLKKLECYDSSQPQ